MNLNMTEDEIKRELWRGKWAAEGHPPNDRDFEYWIPQWNDLNRHGENTNQPNYAYNRLIGLFAGTEDLPKYGPYANPPSDFHPVPPYPGDEMNDDDNTGNEAENETDAGAVEFEIIILLRRIDNSLQTLVHKLNRLGE